MCVTEADLLGEKMIFSSKWGKWAKIFLNLKIWSLISPVFGQ